MLKIDQAIIHTTRLPDLVLPVPALQGRGAFQAAEGDLTVSLDLSSREGLTLLSFSASIKNTLSDWDWWNELPAGPFLDLALTPEEDGSDKAVSFLADYQHKVWWTRPAFGKTFDQVPDRTQFLIIKKQDAWQVLLPLTTDRVRADLSGTGGSLRLTLRALRGGEWALSAPVLIAGEGPDPYGLMDRCVRLARSLMGDAFLLREEKALPPIAGSLGWCSWDSLHRDVSEEALFARMESFREMGIQVPWVLIDDGWSLTDQVTETLSGLDADPEKFPRGLAHTIRVLKEKYHVRWVGVWQAFEGYWNGLTPDSPAHMALKEYCMTYPGGKLSVKPTREAAFGFWNTWHSYLRRQGVDFVKVDNQSTFVQLLHGCGEEEAPLRALHEGLEASVFLNFGGNLINCMGMSPETCYARTASAVTRSSDDYRPLEEGSLYEHILQNVYNSLFQGRLFVCDWDMFWSRHEEAENSAILRALSGGPVYCSDAAGRGDREVLSRLTREDGTLLVCEEPGVPTLDCLTKNALETGGILKVWSRAGSHYYAGCFTGAGNQIRKGALSLSDIPALTGKDAPASWLVYDRQEKTLTPLTEEAPYPLSMKGRSVRLLQLVPAGEDVALIGMTDRYIAGAGIGRVRTFEDRILADLTCGGTFSFGSEKKGIRVLVNGEEVPLRKDGTLFSLQVPAGGALAEILF